MNESTRRLAVVAVSLVVAAGALQARAAGLPEGRWSGALVPPGGAEVAVDLSVSDMAGRPLATLSMPDSRMVGLSNIVVTDDALSFGYFLEGASVQCRLTRSDDGSYSGPCVDGDGVEGSLSVSPAR